MNTNMNQPGLTAEVFSYMQEAEPLLKQARQVYQPHEMALMYKIYNAYTGEKKRDTGCGACRTSVMNKVRKIYQEYQATL